MYESTMYKYMQTVEYMQFLSCKHPSEIFMSATRSNLGTGKGVKISECDICPPTLLKIYLTEGQLFFT